MAIRVNCVIADGRASANCAAPEHLIYLARERQNTSNLLNSVVHRIRAGYDRMHAAGQHPVSDCAPACR